MMVFRDNCKPLVLSLSKETSARMVRSSLRQGFGGRAGWNVYSRAKSRDHHERVNNFPKSKFGFTLIEVLLAMAIIGLILTPIFSIQLGVMRSNSRASEILARIFLGKQFLVDSEFQLKPEDQEKRVEKKIEKPLTTLIYELKRVPDNSALKKFKNILIESVSMQWIDRQGKKRQERLVTFVFKPEGNS